MSNEAPKELKAMQPLIDAFYFTMDVFDLLLDNLEAAHNEGRTDDKDVIYRAFELYTGKVAQIAEQLERVIEANMLLINHRWGNVDGVS